MQLKYSNYAAFSHVHGVAVNNSGLILSFVLIVVTVYLTVSRLLNSYLFTRFIPLTVLNHSLSF